MINFVSAWYGFALYGLVRVHRAIFLFRRRKCLFACPRQANVWGCPPNWNCVEIVKNCVEIEFSIYKTNTSPRQFRYTVVCIRFNGSEENDSSLPPRGRAWSTPPSEYFLPKRNANEQSKQRLRLLRLKIRKQVILRWECSAAWRKTRICFVSRCFPGCW